MMGWQGALLTLEASADTRQRAREAGYAVRRALAAGVSPHRALLEHVVPVFVAPGDPETLGCDREPHR